MGYTGDVSFDRITKIRDTPLKLSANAGAVLNPALLKAGELASKTRGSADRESFPSRVRVA